MAATGNGEYELYAQARLCADLPSMVHWIIMAAIGIGFEVECDDAVTASGGGGADLRGSSGGGVPVLWWGSVGPGAG